MKVTRAKNCHCYTCDRDFHRLGIARHRAWHRDNNTDCRIEFTHGDISSWSYSKNVKRILKGGLDESK